MIYYEFNKFDNGYTYAMRPNLPENRDLLVFATRAWVDTPLGIVVVKDRNNGLFNSTPIAGDALEEFMWIKLKCEA
jgi:hypothetical protein